MRGRPYQYLKIAPTPAKAAPQSSTIISRSSPPTITLEDSDNFVIPPSTIAISSAEATKTVDLAAAISSMKNHGNTSLDSDEDDDGDGALVIDSKDDSMEDKETVIAKEEENEKEPEAESENLDKPLICKHCGMKFQRSRGFKLHVQVNHLKRLGFLCPYCDRSTNSEAMMQQHIRAKHIGLPSKIELNPDAGGPELSDDFWEKEYGLARPKKTRKLKRKRSSVEKEISEEPEQLEKTITMTAATAGATTAFVCPVCKFTAINFTGLRAHMRAHANKQANKHTLKCVHCSFTTNSKTDVWQHSEINHQNLEWRAEEIKPAGSSDDQPAQQFTKTRNEEDYSKDIEEEPVPETIEPKFVHGCFYCNLRSSSLEAVKKHWTKVHKDLNETSKYPTGVEFKYKEIPVRDVANQKLMKCGYCPKKASITHLRCHCRTKHPNQPPKFSEAVDRTRDIWECKWCLETCEGSAKTAHHNMFHSHLPIRFKKQYEMNIMQKGYVCPECGVVTVSLSRMRTHIAKHCDTYRCKRCNNTFGSIAAATQHSTREHPSLAANIEGIVSNIEAMMARVSQTDSAGILWPENDDTPPAPSNDIFRNLGVAKKSTTKQITRPLTSTVRSVARKSTHPLPRYLPGTRFKIDDLDSDDDKKFGYSYYGVKRAPVELANLSTTMAVGGVKMPVKCNTLARIINIDPCVVLKDIEKKEGEEQKQDKNSS